MILQPAKAVLDQGYVALVETWGSDESIIEAARMSTGKGFKGWGTDEQPGDEKLLRYLWENKHATPFEMGGAIFEIKAPIFVFREWHRHRTQSYNEMSARYTPLPDENYVPNVGRLLMVNEQSTNKQAAGSGVKLSGDDALAWLEELEEVYAHAQRVYEKGLAIGISKELARLPLPVARYSKMRAAANLRNWLAFLTLRDDDRAQWEIREFARVVHNMLAEHFPRSLALFDEGRA
jgi:thymidylate synthase (FAD)